MKRFGKNKKGFSLVELIIVVAIMVALIAVMAPAYVKYVSKAHDAVVEAAAESVLQFVKAEMGDGSFTGVGKMYIGRNPDNTDDDSKNIKIIWEDTDPENPMKYQPGDSVADDNGYAEFINLCGVDSSKTIKSDLIYQVEIYTIQDNVGDTYQTASGHPNRSARMGVVTDSDNP